MSQGLSGKRLLVLEDEYLIAMDMRRELEMAGAIVIGPFRTVEEANRRIGDEPEVDGCILDINLQGGNSFSLAELLQHRGIPFLFATGYARDDLPKKWRGARIEMKPLRMTAVASMFE